MKHLDTSRTKSDFRVLLQSRSAQAAVMILKPGDATGDHPENEHPRAQQWLYVASGTGVARAKGRTVKLKPGSLLLIEKGEPHQIRNTGRDKLVTINLYVPPAYTKSGDVKPAVK